MKSDLHKSKMACLQLDTAHGLSGPSVEWYWPEESIPKPDEESDTNSEEDEDSDNDIEVFVNWAMGAGRLKWPLTHIYPPPY